MVLLFRIQLKKNLTPNGSRFQNVVIIVFILSGYMLLAGRVRKPEEALTIQNILEKHFKRTVNPDALFSESQVTSQFSEFLSTNRGTPHSDIRSMTFNY